MVHESVSILDTQKLKKIINLTSPEKLFTGNFLDLIGKWEPSKVMIICEKNLPATLLNKGFNFWSRVNVMTKTNFLKFYIDEWNKKQSKKVIKFEPSDLWYFRQRDLEKYTKNQHIVDLNNYSDNDEDDNDEESHWMNVHVDPQDIEENYTVVTRSEKFWLTCNLIQVTYENLFAIHQTMKNEILMFEPVKWLMISHIGARWIDKNLKLLSENNKKSIKKNREKLINSFIKNWPEWYNKKAIWITPNDVGLTYSHTTFPTADQMIGHHWITIGIHLVPKKLSYSTRSKGKKLSELKVYIYDPLHQPLAEYKHSDRIQNWILIPLQQFLLSLIKAESVSVDKPINALKPVQIFYHPPQTNGTDCGLYCSAALEHFYNFITKYDENQETKIEEIVTGVTQNDLNTKRKNLKDQVIAAHCASTVVVQSNNKTHNKRLVYSTDEETNTHNQTSENPVNVSHEEIHLTNGFNPNESSNTTDALPNTNKKMDQQQDGVDVDEVDEVDEDDQNTMLSDLFDDNTVVANDVDDAKVDDSNDDDESKNNNTNTTSTNNDTNLNDDESNPNDEKSKNNNTNTTSTNNDTNPNDDKSKNNNTNSENLKSNNQKKKSMQIPDNAPLIKQERKSNKRKRPGAFSNSKQNAQPPSKRQKPHPTNKK